MKIKTLKLLLVFCLISLFLSCQTAKKNRDISGKNRTSLASYHEAENYLDAKRADNTIYWGDGMADISMDLWKGKIDARKRAMNALSEQIKIKVSSDVEMVISKNSVSNGGAYSEEVKKSITQKLETYTNQVLTNLKESKLFIDYPQKGTATYVVYISKKEYEAKVKNDLNQKKQLITDTIKSGDKEFVNGNFIAGVNLYARAKQLKQSFFGLIPIYYDIDGDGKAEELTICINDRIRNFFTNIKLTLLNASFLYDSEGLLETLPRVYARYTDLNGEKHHVAGLSLKAVFVKGGGRIAPIITGDYGEVEIPFTRINPRSREVTIRLVVNTAKINGIKKIAAGGGTSLIIKMKRKKTIALAVNFLNNRKNIIPGNIKEKIASILLEKKYSVIHKPFKRESEIKNTKNVNADYIFFVSAKTTGSGAVGQYANMFTSHCGANIKVYKMPLKNQAFSGNIRKAQGFGVSLESAGWDAFGKITDKIIKNAEEIIEGIK